MYNVKEEIKTEAKILELSDDLKEALKKYQEYICSNHDQQKIGCGNILNSLVKELNILKEKKEERVFKKTISALHKICEEKGIVLHELSDEEILNKVFPNKESQEYKDVKKNLMIVDNYIVKKDKQDGKDVEKLRTLTKNYFSKNPQHKEKIQQVVNLGLFLANYQIGISREMGYKEEIGSIGSVKEVLSNVITDKKEYSIITSENDRTNILACSAFEKKPITFEYLIRGSLSKDQSEEIIGYIKNNYKEVHEKYFEKDGQNCIKFGSWYVNKENQSETDKLIKNKGTKVVYKNIENLKLKDYSKHKIAFTTNPGYTTDILLQSKIKSDKEEIKVKGGNEVNDNNYDYKIIIHKKSEFNKILGLEINFRRAKGANDIAGSKDEPYIRDLVIATLDLKEVHKALDNKLSNSVSCSIQ